MMLSLFPWVLCLSVPPGAPPAFPPRMAVLAEWQRQPLPVDRGALPSGDQLRLDRTLARIGAPGAPSLLPPALQQPDERTWLQRAEAARTPQERVTALVFLNRLRSPKALAALAGLGEKDGTTWPQHLHLPLLVASARLNGATVDGQLQSFLDALDRLGKTDATRARAARLRLVHGGKETERLSPIPATPANVLALMDAWNAAPWERRQAQHLGWLKALDLARPAAEPLKAPLEALGLTLPPAPDTYLSLTQALLHRLLEGVGPNASLNVHGWVSELMPKKPRDRTPFTPPLRQAYLGALARCHAVPRASLDPWFDDPNPAVRAGLLAVLRKSAPGEADRLRHAWLFGRHPLLRAAALEDASQVPGNVKGLTQLIAHDDELDSLANFIQGLDRWAVPPQEQKRLLKPFLTHGDWAWRATAHQALTKLDPASPWPTAPKPGKEAAIQLRFAQNLAREKTPVRVRLTFSGKRVVTLRLDPANAPLNLANFIRLARKHRFDRRLVPRVVPDFVIQVGSPFDTMDGGPGYTVRCENSLDWYGPGSVGMALSGKDTGGSQWFITLNATPHLTGKYTRLGEVEQPEVALPLLDGLELGAVLERVQVLR